MSGEESKTTWPVGLDVNVIAESRAPAPPELPPIDDPTHVMFGKLFSKMRQMGITPGKITETFYDMGRRDYAEKLAAAEATIARLELALAAERAEGARIVASLIIDKTWTPSDEDRAFAEGIVARANGVKTPMVDWGVPAEVHERGWQWRPVLKDTAFAPPFGAIRVCMGCGCLVAGGPNVCGRCAEGK